MSMLGKIWGDKKVLRYCLICGAIYLMAWVGWIAMFQTEQISTALDEMALIRDDAVKHERFYWLGQAMTVGSTCLGELFFAASIILDERLLWHLPKRRADIKQKAGKEYIISTLGLVILLALFGTKNLTVTIFAYPTVLYLFLLAVVLLRLYRRLLPDAVEDCTDTPSG